MLDSNKETINRLAKTYKKSLLYTAPRKLPFNDNSIKLIHSSHLVEHLTIQELHDFLTEIDRVLTKGGTLIISTPLLNKNFYSDRSHVRPYNPAIFSKFLCPEKQNSPTYKSISNNYSLEDITYRYRIIKNDEDYGSCYLIIDIIIMIFKKIFFFLGVRRYIKNGYTIILKKC